MKQCSVHDGAMVSSSSGQWTGHVTWAFVLETAVCPATILTDGHLSHLALKILSLCLLQLTILTQNS